MKYKIKIPEPPSKRYVKDSEGDGIIGVDNNYLNYKLKMKCKLTYIKEIYEMYRM